MEFEMLEARLAEYGDLVDVFLILESNYTAHGDPKPLRLLNQLRTGQYSKYACKFVHVFLNFFPQRAYINGWIMDDLLRNFITKQALPRQLKGYRHDDIFLLFDADEIPLRETVLFLKLHEGYPEPIGFNLQWNTFGYFWKANSPGITHVFAAVTMGMLFHVFESRAILLRSAPYFIHNEGANNLNKYLRHENISVYPWSFGDEDNPVGWHCSWCCNLSCIQTKLVSAQNGDFPRWGDFRDKRRLSYIKHLVKAGVWFDNVSKMIATSSIDNPMYAPNHFLENEELYSHILWNPFHQTITVDVDEVDRVLSSSEINIQLPAALKKASGATHTVQSDVKLPSRAGVNTVGTQTHSHIHINSSKGIQVEGKEKNNSVIKTAKIPT